MSRLCSLLFIAAVATACTSTPTGSACPTNNAPTYDNFGRAFVTDYCIGCHSRTATDRRVTTEAISATSNAKRPRAAIR